jgi:hypothetical protein
VVGFGISDVEHSGFATRVLVQYDGLGCSSSKEYEPFMEGPR